ncbi:nucleotide sugar dehydrogenase [Acidimicrobiia bacterium]|jgi:UDP-N-acetyl-D-mannosaminuronic acid dehydrogenase|nr:nucleotide sugar dehydrogenase [Acidimicrobiia bacterium]
MRNGLKKVSVIGGAGHIGLPLSCYIASKDHQVSIIDTNLDTINKLKEGILPFNEFGLEEYWSKTKNLIKYIGPDIEAINTSDFIIITLGTSSKKSDVKLFDDVLINIIMNAKIGAKILLRSTVGAESIDSIVNNKIFNKKKMYLAYCPERIAEGFSLLELSQIPQIIGVNTHDEYIIYSEFFNSLNISSLKTTIKNAIFVKLFTNTYRYAEFSTVNEFYNIALKNSIDFDEIINIATLDYPRLSNMPSKGFVGGPCLIKDTETFITEYDPGSTFLKSLQISNQNFLLNTLNQCKSVFTGNKLIQFGLSFKPNSDDIRSSISLQLNKLLKENNFEVYAVDDNLKSDDVGFKIYKFNEISTLTNNILVTTYHDEFKNYDFSDKKVLIIGNK